jgi:hypothetical protein
MLLELFCRHFLRVVPASLAIAAAGLSRAIARVLAAM